jgi:hypothetical protein
MTLKKVKKLTMLQKNIINCILELDEYKINSSGSGIKEIALYKYQYDKIIDICEKINEDFYLNIGIKKVKIIIN